MLGYKSTGGGIISDNLSVKTLRWQSKNISGEVELPGSKSVLNRMLVLAELAGAEVTTDIREQAEDVRKMSELITRIRKHEGDFRQEAIELDCGNAGTVFRFLTSLCTLKQGNWILTGSERMKERPVAALAEVLRVGGADIEYLERQGFPPLLIKGGKQNGSEGFAGGNLGKIAGDVSSQFISSLLMSGAFCPLGITLEVEGRPVSAPYLEMTVALMKEIGFNIKKTQGISNAGNTIYQIDGNQIIDNTIFQKTKYEKDWSSASYFYEIASFSDSCEILLKGLSKKSIQGDSILPELYSRLGVRTQFTAAGAVLTKAHLPGMPDLFRFDFSNYPDLALTLAVSCAGMGVEAHFTGLKSLVIKESDRLEAVVRELNRCGCPARSVDYELIIPSGKSYTMETATLKTYHDHRIAMAFAPLAMILGEMRIEEAEVVEKSFPGFWEEVDKLQKC